MLTLIRSARVARSSTQQQQSLLGVCQRRTLWEYINRMFNQPDPERIKTLGPDRACAEWVLRNGGSVVWAGGVKQTNYNLLPSESQSVPKLIEIDGTSSSISHYGFAHLSMQLSDFSQECQKGGGCTALKKIVLDEGKYIDDRAMKGLEYGKSTLAHVQVSRCPDVTDNGVKELKILDKLETLVLFQLQSVENLAECKQTLQSYLPKCKIQGEKTP